VVFAVEVVCELAWVCMFGVPQRAATWTSGKFFPSADHFRRVHATASPAWAPTRQASPHPLSHFSARWRVIGSSESFGDGNMHPAIPVRTGIMRFRAPRTVGLIEKLLSRPIFSISADHRKEPCGVPDTHSPGFCQPGCLMQPYEHGGMGEAMAGWVSLDPDGWCLHQPDRPGCDAEPLREVSQ
jgi:hypothetical protein